jgi:membrane-associated phospholipid phosphatase
MEPWILATRATQLRARFRASWNALPELNRRRWMVTIGMGLVALFGVMVLIISIAQVAVARQMFDWEPNFLRALELRGPFGFSSALWFQTFGTDITLAFLVLFAASLSAWNGRPLTALSIVLAFVVVDFVVRMGWLLWARPRPDVIAQGVAAPSFHSFPSGHTGKTLAVYGFLASIWWRASGNITERVFILVSVAFIAVIVPLARLRMGVHWPSDIVGGYVMGLTWLAVLLVAERQESGPAFTSFHR